MVEEDNPLPEFNGHVFHIDDDEFERRLRITSDQILDQNPKQGFVQLKSKLKENLSFRKRYHMVPNDVSVILKACALPYNSPLVATRKRYSPI